MQGAGDPKDKYCHDAKEVTVFRDRVFNVSFLFSFLWHLFWIFAICIVITPTVQPSNLYQEVDFLGPILEKTAFDLMVEGVKPQTETLYARSTLFADGACLKPRGPRRKVLRMLIPGAINKKTPLSVRDYLEEAKEIPGYFTEDIKAAYVKSRSRAWAFLIEGPAAEREIIFKPKPLTVPHGLYGDRDEYIIRLKFFVSDNGLVYEVEPVISSGYPEVDLRAIRYLKGWRFSPLYPTGENGTAWGIVTVRVGAK